MSSVIDQWRLTDFIGTYEFLEGSFGDDVVLHKVDISSINGEKNDGFPPNDNFVDEKNDESDQRNGIKGAITKQRPPGQA